MALKYDVIKVIRDISLLTLVFLTILVFCNVNFSSFLPPEETFILNFKYFISYFIISPILSIIIIVLTIIGFRNKKKTQRYNKNNESEDYNDRTS